MNYTSGAFHQDGSNRLSRGVIPTLVEAPRSQFLATVMADLHQAELVTSSARARET